MVESSEFGCVGFRSILGSMGDSLRLFSGGTLVLRSELLGIVCGYGRGLKLELGGSGRVLLRIGGNGTSLPFSFCGVRVLFTATMAGMPGRLRLVPKGGTRCAAYPPGSGSPLVGVSGVNYGSVYYGRVFVIERPRVRERVRVGAFVPLSVSGGYGSLYAGCSPRNRVGSRCSMSLRSGVVGASFGRKRVFLYCVNVLRSRRNLPVVPFRPLLGSCCR